jgi:hypothetical protein
VLVGADGDDVVVGGGGEAAGGAGGAEVHCTSTPATVASAATVRSGLNAPTGADSIVRDLIRNTAVLDWPGAAHGTRDIRIASL